MTGPTMNHDLPPKPAPGVRLYIVGDEGVLFSPGRQELYGINPMATLIWCCIEEGMAAVEIADRLVAALNVPGPVAAAFVRDACAGWRATGMLEGGDPPPPAPSPDVQGWLDPALAATFPPPAATWVRERRYRLLDRLIAVRFTDQAQDAIAHPVLAHLEQAAGEPDSVVAVTAAGGNLYVFCDGEPAGWCAGLDALAPIVKHTVWRKVLGLAEFFLDIHAGVVGDGCRCLLLPAAPGSGKSTLTAGLVRAGWRFLSDEVALLDPGTLAVRPMPMAFCVKSTGFEVARRLFPELDHLPVHRRGDGKLVRYIPPEPGMLGPDPNGRYPVAGIIFPRYDPDAETRMVPVSPTEALRRIMEECLILRAPLDEDNVADVVRWIEGTPCRELVSSSLDQAIGLIEETWPRV